MGSSRLPPSRKVLLTSDRAAAPDVPLPAGPDWLAALGASADACRVVPPEQARQALVGAAEASDADLLVVEARPRVLGPFAADLLASAGCSALVARRSYGRGPIVVGFDFSDPALAAVASARTVARRLAVPLVVLHALGSGGSGPPAISRGVEAARAVQDAVGGPVEVRVVGSAPEYALLAAERELGARLLVVGAGVARAALGSVAMAVTTAATGPVLLVRDPPAASA